MLVKLHSLNSASIARSRRDANSSRAFQAVDDGAFANIWITDNLSREKKRTKMKKNERSSTKERRRANDTYTNSELFLEVLRARVVLQHLDQMFGANTL
jgi:hypothetical protein